MVHPSLDDIKDVGEENGLHEASIWQLCNLKKLLQLKFGDKIGFYNVGYHFMVHPSSDDFKDIGEENGLHMPSICQSCKLKELLQQRFGDEIGFYNVGNHLIFHPSSISSFLYFNTSWS